MRVLVTGADGFAGRYLVRRLVEAGHEVVAGCRPGGAAVDWTALGAAVRPQPLEITSNTSIEAALDSAPDGIVHLAAVASVREASADPGAAWTINAAGTGRLVSAVAARREAGRGDPVLLLVSTAEVYGKGSGAPRRETDPLLPQSPYAASKVAAEVAALEAWRRAGVRVVIARPFPHTGRGQTRQYVLPTFVEQLRAARKTGALSVPAGNLERVRDFLDVRDVVEAYLRLLTRGVPGEAYNVARGEGVMLGELFHRLAELVGVKAEPKPDPSLMRKADVPHLVGDSTKLRRATGWAPTIALDETLRGMVDAEAD